MFHSKLCCGKDILRGIGVVVVVVVVVVVGIVVGIIECQTIFINLTFCVWFLQPTIHKIT